MRALIIGVISVVALACTKPNPNRCCNDEADCVAKGIPVGSICEQGLVCRGNQCISQPCASSAECDPAAPYCVADLCAEACTEDAQCPGFGGDASTRYCESGSCVACRDSITDCGGNQPVCDAGACRACTAHSECASDLCDTRSGACVSETVIVYATPTGSSTSACTKSDPCTLARAFAVVDATRNHIKLSNTTHTAPQTSISTGTTIELYGPAQINSTFDLDVVGATTLRVRDVVFGAGIYAHPAIVSGPMPTLDLDNVTFSDNVSMTVYPGVLQARGLKMRTTDNNINLITAGGELNGSGGATANRGSVLTIAESLFDAPINGITLATYSSAQIKNTIFRNASSPLSFDLSTLASTVSFSTFYNSRWICANAAVIFTGSNNVFLNEAPSAPSTTVGGTSCVHNYSIIKPQSTTPPGANNLLNMDPRFVNGANGDLHLVAGSPAIDAADPGATETRDYEGTVRPQGAGRDVGAFEYH